jgi:hypothetical protein
MSATEKSDLPEVAKKRANKTASAAAELVERRGGTKENAELQSTVRTQSRAAVSQTQARIREAVIRNKQSVPTFLYSLKADSYFGSSNPRQTTLLGCRESEVCSMSIFELLHPEDRDRTLSDPNA